MGKGKEVDEGPLKHEDVEQRKALVRGKMTSSRYARPYAPSVLFSIAAAALSSIACVAFSLAFQRAIAGFAKQIGAFVTLGDWNSWLLQAALVVFTLCFVAYLLFVHLASLHMFNGCLNRLGTSCVLMLSSFGSQAFLIVWVLVLCFVCSLSLVYFIFIGSIYSFCALVDNQCFDFKVLLPALVKRFSNKQIDLTFCEEKKAILCDRENNMIWTFGWSFVLGLAAFAGVLAVQNVVVYSFGKRRGNASMRKAGNIKGEAYEMSEKE